MESRSAPPAHFPSESQQSETAHRLGTFSNMGSVHVNLLDLRAATYISQNKMQTFS